jgi:flagellum-specific ATP synthase
LSTYLQSEDLINIGAYKRGSSKEIDEAIRIYPKIIAFLKQGTDEKVSMQESIEALQLLIEKGD